MRMTIEGYDVELDVDEFKRLIKKNVKKNNVMHRTRNDYKHRRAILNHLINNELITMHDEYQGLHITPLRKVKQ